WNGARLNATTQPGKDPSGHVPRTNRESPTPARPLPLAAGSILYLQRTIGNQAVQRMLAGSWPMIQRKLGFELEIAADLKKESTGARSDEKSTLLAKDEDAGSITKGETITTGAGWRLTPDGRAGDW